MLEVNLQNFSNEDLSDSALSQLDTILSAWQRHGSQVILRFLYDWDGKAMETEPQSLEQILRHMDQTAEVVNRYTDCVFLMQGIFVGNCGEMNNSHYMSDEDCTTLMHHLAEVTDPSVFCLSAHRYRGGKFWIPPNGRQRKQLLMVRFPPGLDCLTMVCSERPTIPALMVIPLPPQTLTVPPGFVRMSFLPE